MVTALGRPRIFIPIKKFALILISHQGPPLYNGQSTLSPVPRVAVVERFHCSDNFNGDFKPQTLRTSVLCLLVFSPTILYLKVVVLRQCLLLQDEKESRDKEAKQKEVKRSPYGQWTTVQTFQPPPEP